MAGYIGSAASVVSSGAENKKTFTITGATTSLTGLNYTVNKVHVFQNGVRLVDGTDYTATNGTTITLTVAAQNGDNVVVISQASFQVSGAVSTSGGTMTGDLTVQGAFTSQGIDDNGNATALTIDSSENVLIGKASSSATTQGIEARADGRLWVSTSSDDSIFNRAGTDGGILSFRKNGSAIGSIGVDSNDNLTISASTANHGGLYMGTNTVIPMSGGAESSGTVSLGNSGTLWKDAYLSGGVYLGGTGSANKLEDYEEGTWTPSVSSGTIVIATGSAEYIKVGRNVTCWCRIKNFSDTSSSTHFRLESLPFNKQIGDTNIGYAWGNGMGAYRAFYFYDGSGSNNSNAYGGSASVAGYGPIYHSTFSVDTEMLIKLQYKTP